MKLEDATKPEDATINSWGTCPQKESDASENNIPTYKYYRPGLLTPGEVRLEYFNILVDICTVKNPNMVQALALVLVYGVSRKDACVKNGIATSYLSVKIKEMQRISVLIQEVYLNSPWEGGACSKNGSCSNNNF